MSRPFQYLTDAQGDRTAVIPPIDEHERLLENFEDLAVVAERRGEPVLSHEEFLADLKGDGAL